MSREYPQMRLRMSPELREKIEEESKVNGRSMNAEIVHRLEESFKKDEEVDTSIIISADEAKRRSETHLKNLDVALRKFAFSKIYDAIKLGKDEAIMALPYIVPISMVSDYLSNPSKESVIGLLISELEEMGYKVNLGDPSIERDSNFYLHISFSD